MAVVVERGVEPPTSKAKRRGRGCCKLLRETENLRESVQFATRRPSFPRSAFKGWIEPRYSRAELDTRGWPVFTCRENCNTFARCHRQVLDEREENEKRMKDLFETRDLFHVRSRCSVRRSKENSV